MDSSSTRELVTAAQFSSLAAVLSTAGLLAAVLFGVLGQKKSGSERLRPVLISAACAAAWPLWLVYNLIEDHFGLDSVAALLINLVLFLVLGTAFGLLYRRFSEQPHSEKSTG